MDTMVTNKLPTQLLGRYVRINVITFTSQAPCMRFELYGCGEAVTPTLPPTTPAGASTAAASTQKPGN